MGSDGSGNIRVDSGSSNSADITKGTAQALCGSCRACNNCRADTQSIMKGRHTMNSKAYLGQIARINTQIKNKTAEIQQWKEIATSTTAPIGGEKVQTSSNPHKMANAIAKYVDMEAEIGGCIAQLAKTKAEIIATIETLPTDEYDVLHLRYVQQMPWKEVAYNFRKNHTGSKSNVTAIHGRALRRLQKILDERESHEKD